MVIDRTIAFTFLGDFEEGKRRGDEDEEEEEHISIKGDLSEIAKNTKDKSCIKRAARNLSVGLYEIFCKPLITTCTMAEDPQVYFR